MPDYVKPQNIGPTPGIQIHDNLIQERGKTHGDWGVQAQMGHDLRTVMRRGKNWNDLPATIAEAFDMIQTKISRALTGDWTEVDHLDDIIGYAVLARNTTPTVLERRHDGER